MSFNFVIPETNIGGGTGTPTLQFYKRGFVLNGSSGGSPSWRDIILSGNTALTLVNAKANGLNYVKLFGGCEQTGTPTPDNPIDIVCNNGALKARRQSGLPLRYQLVEWLSSTNGITITDFKTKDTQTFKAKFIRNGSSAQYIYYSDTASSGTTNTTAYISGSANWRFDGTTKTVSITQDANILRKTIQNKNGVWVDGEWVATYTNVSSFTSTNDLTVLGSASASPLQFYNLQVEEGGVNILDVVPVKDLIDDTYGVYDLIGQQFYTNPNATITAGNTVSDPIEIYTDGTTETVEVDTTGDMAMAEMLLAVGDYKDEQNVTTGAVTRKVGIKVLDGTESWTRSEQSQFFFVDNVIHSAESLSLCTHFVNTSGADTAGSNKIRLFNSPTINNRTIIYASLIDYTTAEAFKQWLASQYANGTPVIVVYPLATPTTETVTAQHLTTQAGTNIVEITQASIDNLELEVSYKGTI